MWKAKWAVAKWTHTGRKRAALLRATGSGGGGGGGGNGGGGDGGDLQGNGAGASGPADPSHPWDAN